MSALPSCDRCVLDAHAAMAPEFDAHCRVPVLCDSSCNLRAILNSYGTTKPVNAMLSLAIVHHRCMSSLIAPLFPQVRHLGHLDGRRHGVRDVGGHYRVRCCAAFTRIHAIAKNHTLFHTLLHTVTTRFRCSLPIAALLLCDTSTATEPLREPRRTAPLEPTMALLRERSLEERITG